MRIYENEDKVFRTWLGHSFIGQLQQSYLAKRLAQNRRLRVAAKIFSFIFLAGMISFLSVGIYAEVQSAHKIRDLQNQKKAIWDEATQQTEKGIAVTVKEMDFDGTDTEQSFRQLYSRKRT